MRAINWTIGLALAAAGAAAAGAAAGQPSADVAAFEQALAQGRLPDAAAAFDRLVAARRPTDGKLRPDPLLSALAGRLSLARGHATAARIYLQSVDLAALPADAKGEAQMALLQAQQRTGDRTGAGATLALLHGRSFAPAQTWELGLANARQVVLADPRAAADLVQPLVSSALPARRWEAELLLAQAFSLAGDLTRSQAAAERAWASSVHAPSEDLAAMRVGLQRASLAAARGDRDRLLAMLDLAGAATAVADRSLASPLPLCGRAGLRPDDQVTVGVHQAFGGEQVVVPLLASRTEIIAPFVDALAGREILSDAPRHPVGTIITLRCRLVPAADYDVADPGTNRLLAWTSANGLFFRFGETGDDAINQASDELDELRARYGEDHPFLIPIRLELAGLLTWRAGQKGDVQEWQVRELEHKAKAAIRAAGGTDLYPDESLEAMARSVQAADSPEKALALYRAATLKIVESAPADEAYTVARLWFAQDRDLPSETQTLVIENLLKRYAAGDPRRTSLLVRLAGIQKKSGAKSFRETYRRAGISEDACITFEDNPELEEQKITDGDYPTDGVHHSIAGATVLEYSVTPEGRVSAPRIIVGAPSLLFDPVVLDELNQFRYKPPKRNGRAASCRGVVQPIKWKLPDQPEFQLPTFMEPNDEEA